MSISRPDPASPEQVADASFSTGRRGYDQDEVRDFLRMVSTELGRLRERERFLEAELRSAQTNPDLDTAVIDDEQLVRLVGEETVRVLNAARESANEIRLKAEQSAARILTEASDEAARRREEAEVEASRLRTDAANDAENEISMAKQQGREMVNEARAYRERVLTELSRRRELAREQIEQLLQGRDRLMQAFERARLVAVDVVAELQPIGEPDEYVDLTPTTGPVPVMQARTAAPADEVDTTIAETIEPEAIEPETIEPETIEPEAIEPEAIEPEAVEPEADEIEVDEERVDDEPDDVVVDLFARIRDQAAEPDDAAEVADDEVVADEVAAAEVADADAEVADVEDGADELVEASVFEQRDADLTPLIVAGAKKLKRVLADEQNDVLERLRQTEAVADLADIAPDHAEHMARYADSIRDDLLVAANAGAQLTSSARTAKLGKAQGNEAVAEAATVLDDWLLTPLRDRLERCIRDGNGDNAQITKKVRAAYREWKTQHIDEHLDDVLRAAHGNGVLNAFETGTPLHWTPDPRHDSCPDCDDNGLEGVVPAGEPFPTGHRFAPAHPGCRCLLIADAP